MAAVKAGCDAALMHAIGNLGLNQHKTALAFGLKRAALQSGEILTWFSTNLRKATSTPTELRQQPVPTIPYTGLCRV